MSSGAKLTPEDLKAWLDRPAPKGNWREHLELQVLEGGAPDQREWEEFELARAADPLAEAGHG